MANKQWPRWVAAVAALAMAGSLPGTALAAPAQGDAASTTPTLSTGNLKSKVSSQLQQAKGEVTAFIQTTSPSALERKNSVLKNFSRQRSALPTLKQRAQSAQAATQSAKTAEKTSVNVFSQLQSLDSSAKKIYSTSYALSGVAVRADAASLRKLAEQSGSVAHITILTSKKALDTTNGSGEAPANKNNDQLVNAVKTWEQTGKTGKGVNIAVVDTGLDYTHADFGGAGTTEAYQTALTGSDIVSVCPRTVRGSSGLFYKVFNAHSQSAYRLRTDAFRLVTRRAINRVHASSAHLPYRKAAYAASGLKMTDLEFDGQLTVKSKGRFNLALDSLALYTNAGFKASMTVTLCMLALALAELVYTLVVFITGHPVEGWTTTMFVITVGFSGLFAVLTIVVKYLSLLVDLVFKQQKYLVESIEKLQK